MNEKSTQYVLAEKMGNLVAEKNTTIAVQAAHISQLEAAVMFYAGRYHDEHHQSKDFKSCQSDVCIAAQKLLRTQS